MKQLLPARMTRLLSPILLLGCALASLSVPAFAKESVLTSLPVNYWLASDLLKHTEVEVRYLPSPRFSMSRHQAWFEAEQEAVAQAAKEAKAVVTIRSVWPQDPIFPQVRQHNIGVIQIDSAQSLLPRAQSVALVQYKQQVSPYVWLNPANLVTMLGILSDDLQRVFPKWQTQIRHNQREVALAVQQLILTNQQRLMAQDIESVLLLDEALIDFAAGYSLHVQGVQTKSELEWDAQDVAQIRAWIALNPNLWIATTRPVSPKLRELLPEFSHYLQVDTVSRLGSSKSGVTIERWRIKAPEQEAAR
ncbi:metal ABC transporter solute-binding protein, Zn/Mn family [Vibrio navarrensis]|uniref:metal ABC transporter solute-binding protein, Zn/Mn family n=1 Tax=Vibrio navarrensis TaxID=29495 RepID=UPI0018686FDC|nr:zinc ABC transporter substrate-binding protein [Vibrio navarrensis]MBE3652016.1 metal ABC transporter [Vibrio navarrensis]